MSNQNKYTDSLPTQFKWHTWDDELNYDDKLTNLSFAFTTFDPIDDVYEVKKETMVIPVIKFGQIAYPTYDWQNVAQPTYDPVKGDIPRSILSSIESTQPLLDEFTRFKRAQRNDLTAAQKCQLLHDQRATKSPFRLDWRISNINQSQAYYFYLGFHTDIYSAYVEQVRNLLNILFLCASNVNWRQEKLLSDEVAGLKHLDNYGSFMDLAIFYSKLRGYFTTPFGTLGSLCIFTHICWVMVLLLLLFLLFHGRREALWARVGYHVCNSTNVIIHYFWNRSYCIWF
eukprot:805993_1